MNIYMYSFQPRSVPTFQVSQIFKDASIGNPVTIALVKLVVLDEDFVQRRPGEAGVSANALLKRFCDWQERNINPNEHHYDTALLLTR